MFAIRHMTALALAMAAPVAAHAQTAYLEQSGITGFGTTLQISRLPTADSSGKIKYWDVVINLAVAAGGKPSVASTTATMSARLVTDHFVPGRYYVKDGSAATQFGSVVEGVGSGGSTVWTLLMDQAPNSAFPMQTTWQTGAPSPDVAARLTAAKVMIDPNYSYGITEIGNHICCGNDFQNDNGLMAAEQVSGTELDLISYSSDGVDRATQTGSILLGLCKDTACSNAPP